MRNFRALPLVVAALIAVTNAGQASAALIGQSMQTGIAALKEWNVVAFNNFTTSNHVGGRTLVGGNLNVTNGVMAMGGTGSGNSSYGTSAITVAGNANFSNGNVNGAGVQVGGNLTGNFNNNGGGAVQAGGTAQSQQNFSVQGGQGANFTNTIVSQAADIKASLTSLSANLKALTTTSNVQLLQPAGSAQTNENQNSPYWNTNQINVTGTGLAVLNMTEAQFEQFGASQKDMKITLPSGATLVINVAGTNIDYAGKVNMNSGTNYGNVIWNFYEATSLNLQNQFSGSVLGVFADITVGNSGNVDGTIAGKSVTQNANGEIHSVPFTGDLSSVSGSVVSTAPEPSTWAMLILGFGLVGAVMRTRGRRVLAIQAA